MKRITSMLTVIAMCTSVAFLQLQPTRADTIELDITSSTIGLFTRTAGQVVDFSGTSTITEANPGGRWNAHAPINGQLYSVDSIQFTKGNNDNNISELWVGVYTTLTGTTFLSGFLGASDSSVAWGTGDSGDEFTWTFSNIHATANSDVKLYFVFQTDAAARSQVPNVPDQHISLQRISSSTSIGDYGAIVIHGNPGVGTVANRTAFMNLKVTAIPEPSTAIIGALVAGMMLIRRRRSC